jgi:hypothetical protein
MGRYKATRQAKRQLNEGKHRIKDNRIPMNFSSFNNPSFTSLRPSRHFSSAGADHAAPSGFSYFMSR